MSSLNAPGQKPKGAGAAFGMAGLLLLSGTVSVCAPATLENRVLRVALYPFVPDRASLYLEFQEKFEAQNPGLDLQYVDLSENYYDTAKPKAIVNTDADVLEVDSALLQDMVDANRIQPLPRDLIAGKGTYLAVAEAASSIGTITYGAPHWVCTNYIFSRKGDPLERAKTLGDLRAQFKEPRQANQGLLIDLKGKTTLGEIYLDALMDRDRDIARVRKHLTDETFDTKIGESLKELRGFCDDDLCRDDDYHDAEGFYARLFAHKRGRALAGYSERLYFIQYELLNACKKGGGDCVSGDEIAIAPLPLSENGSQPFAWVDMLTISKTCVGQCLTDAKAFIRYVSSVDSVRSALVPGWAKAPRYLLPAHASLYADKSLLKAAPLYSALEPAVRDAVPITGAGLIPNLRAIGKRLDEKVIGP